MLNLHILIRLKSSTYVFTVESRNEVWLLALME